MSSTDRYYRGVLIGIVIYLTVNWVMDYLEPRGGRAVKRFTEICMRLDKTRAECDRAWEESEHWVINERGAHRQ